MKKIFTVCCILLMMADAAMAASAMGIQPGQKVCHEMLFPAKYEANGTTHINTEGRSFVLDGVVGAASVNKLQIRIAHIQAPIIEKTDTQISNIDKIYGKSEWSSSRGVFIVNDNDPVWQSGSVVLDDEKNWSPCDWQEGGM